MGFLIKHVFETYLCSFVKSSSCSLDFLLTPSVKDRSVVNIPLNTVRRHQLSLPLFCLFHRSSHPKKTLLTAQNIRISGPTHLPGCWNYHLPFRHLEKTDLHKRKHFIGYLHFTDSFLVCKYKHFFSMYLCFIWLFSALGNLNRELKSL